MSKPGFLNKLSRLFQGSTPETPESTTTVTASESPPVADSSRADQANSPAPSAQAAPTATISTTPPSATARPRRQEPPSMPELDTHLTLEQIAYNGGPEVKIVTRGGAKIYAVCPKCEAMWNIKDRMTVILQKRLDKSLTCAACEQVVALPQSLNIRKL